MRAVAGCGSRLDAGGDNRYAHHAFELFIKGRAKDDDSVAIHLAADPVCSFIHLEQRHVEAAGHIDQHGAGALHRNVIQQRVVDCGLGGLRGAAFAGCLAGAHHGLAHLAHHRTDIGKIEIDLAGLDHQVGDPGHTLMQYRIGDVEGIGKGGALIRQPEQVLVGNNDQRVDPGLHLLDSGIGLCHPALAFEIKWLGDNANRQDAAFTCRPGNHRGSPGAGAATHAGGDEDHVAIGKLAHHRLDAFFGCRASDIRL